LLLIPHNVFPVKPATNKKFLPLQHVRHGGMQLYHNKLNNDNLHYSNQKVKEGICAVEYVNGFQSDRQAVA
jgi:hypothetical protein